VGKGGGAERILTHHPRYPSGVPSTAPLVGEGGGSSAAPIFTTAQPAARQIAPSTVVDRLRGSGLLPDVAQMVAGCRR